MTKLTKMGAIISLPNIAYSDIRPEVEADTPEDALDFLAGIARQVGADKWADSVAPKKQAPTGDVKLVTKKSIDGTEVLFDPVNHTYTDPDGKVKYMGGSTFASLVATKFDSQSVAQKVAKDGLTADQVLNLWGMRNKVSCDFGESIHKALETYQKFHSYAAILGGEEKILPNSPYLQDVVRNFFTPERKEEQAMSEVFVANHKYGLCGFIDRLVFLDKDTRTVEVQDFKSNDLSKKVTFIPQIREAYKDAPKNKLGEYMFQLSFYAFILKDMGYNVKSCRIFNLDDTEWKEEEFKPLDITDALKIVRGNNLPNYGGSPEDTGWGDVL